MSLVYSNERPLFRILSAVSCFFWLGLVVGTFGIALLYAPLFLVGYLFAQSGFISMVRGSGVKVSRGQLPEIQERLERCCTKLEMEEVPEAYVLNAHGLLNALATRFLRRHYVVLFSDVVDALADQPDALDFYIGHELGHIKRGHLAWGWFLAPASVLPVLGAAYSRAREYSCDLHGLACCDDPRDAACGLAVLAAGERSIEKLNLQDFARQSEETGGFWMSYHELTADYPWLTKRMKRLIAQASGQPDGFPSRHPLAFVLALFVPRIGVPGAGGGLAGMMAMVAIVGVLAAVAIPNFVRFQAKARLVEVQQTRAQVESAASDYIYTHDRMPGTLEDLALPDDFAGDTVARVEVADDHFVLHLAEGLEAIGGEQVVLTPYVEEGELLWECQSTLEGPLAEDACKEASLAPAAPAADGGIASQVVGNEGFFCSTTWREGDEYAALSPAQRAAVREHCNAWKLRQVE